MSLGHSMLLERNQLIYAHVGTLARVADFLISDESGLGVGSVREEPKPGSGRVPLPLGRLDIRTRHFVTYDNQQQVVVRVVRLRTLLRARNLIEDASGAKIASLRQVHSLRGVRFEVLDPRQTLMGTMNVSDGAEARTYVLRDASSGVVAKFRLTTSRPALSWRRPPGYVLDLAESAFLPMRLVALGSVPAIHATFVASRF